jgi:hypothetical protein
MPTLLPRLLILIAGISSIGSVRAHPLIAFPSIPARSATPILAIANVRPGKYLPQFAECIGSALENICIDPPPFWFAAKITSILYGPRVAEEVSVATTSHYGMDELEFVQGPQLLMLRTNGHEFVMPRYAMAPLTADRSGELYLIILSSSPISWLPCSVTALRQKISASDFVNDLEIPKKQASPYVTDSPELFVATQNGFIPQYAISMSRLQSHMASLSPTSTQMACEQSSKQ